MSGKVAAVNLSRQRFLVKHPVPRFGSGMRRSAGWTRSIPHATPYLVLQRIGAYLVVVAMAFAFAGPGARTNQVTAGDARLFTTVEQHALHQAPRHDGDARAFRPHAYRAADHHVTPAGLLPAPRASLTPDQWIWLRAGLVAFLNPDQPFPAKRTSRGPPPADVLSTTS